VVRLEVIKRDGSGRATNRALCFDIDEATYAEAGTLTGDTVIEETRTVYDRVGGVELVAQLARRHNGAGDGSLTVGSSGNGRAQYMATWYDKLHRAVTRANYGTNGGTAMTGRPTGSPPASTSATSLVTMTSYTVRREVEEEVDTGGTKSRSGYDDAGRIVWKVENYDNGTPGPDPDVDALRHDVPHESEFAQSFQTCDKCNCVKNAASGLANDTSKPTQAGDYSLWTRNSNAFVAAVLTKCDLIAPGMDDRFQTATYPGWKVGRSDDTYKDPPN
jgi:hypothetical protein